MVLISKNSIELESISSGIQPTNSVRPGDQPYTPSRHQACGKAIIIGEHAVVYGARAVAMPLIDMKLSLDVVSDKNGNEIEMVINNKNIANELADVVEQAFELLDVKPFSFKIRGESKLIIGAGLGSSAALCVAILRAISYACNRPLDYKLLAKLGNILEGRFHGRPSGLDTSVVAFEQIITFKKGESAKPLDVRGICPDDQFPNILVPWRFLIIDSNERSSTKDMVSLAAPYFTGIHGPNRIEKFDSLASAVIDGLTVGNENTVAKAMNSAATMLKEAKVSTKKLDYIIKSSLHSGCLAVKPTGAGGGGCLLALLPSIGWQETIKNLETNLESHNIHKAFIS